MRFYKVFGAKAGPRGLKATNILFPEKSEGQGSPLVGGPLALRPYWSREGAVNLGRVFLFDENSVF